MFFFNDTATTEIYTLSLHDALPISQLLRPCSRRLLQETVAGLVAAVVVEGLEVVDVDHRHAQRPPLDRKSTRLNSSHANISYAVFCLKQKIEYNLILVTKNKPCSHT